LGKFVNTMKLRVRVRGIGATVGKVASAIGKAIDLRDCFVFGGLGVMGYGLYLFRPWVAFTVCGAILLAIGIFIGRGKD
jgi:hypothetical protein